MEKSAYTDFEAHCREVIPPLVSGARRIRRKSVRTFRVLMLFSAALVGSAVYANQTYGLIAGFWGWFTIGILALVLFVIASAPLRGGARSMRFLIVPKVVGFLPRFEFKDIRYGEQTMRPLHLLRDSGFPDRDYLRHRNRIQIVAADNRFEMFLVDFFMDLQASRDGSATPEHEALMLRADSRREFTGRSVLASVKLTDSYVASEGLERIRTVPLAGRDFELHATNASAAACFDSDLTSSLAECLGVLGDKIILSRLQCGFSDGQFLLHLPVKNQPFDLRHSAADPLTPENLWPIVAELEAIEQVALHA